MFAFWEKNVEGAAPRHHLSFDIPPRPSDTRAMIELEQARQRIFAALAPLPPEPVPLDAAVGRVASEPIISPIDLPTFDNSAVDGYAVSATDLRAKCSLARSDRERASACSLVRPCLTAPTRS
jgi:hypothetical protein